MLRFLFHVSVILCSISLLGCSNDSPYTATTALVLTETNDLTPIFTPRTSAEKSVQLERYATLITGYPVLNAVLAEPHIQELECIQHAAGTYDLIDWLEKRITVEFSHASEMLTISVSSSTPEQAIVLCKSVVDSFLKEVVIEERLAMLKTFNMLRDQYLRKVEKVRVKRDDIEELAMSGGSDPAQKLFLDQIDRYRQEVNRLHFETANKSVELAFLEGEEKQTPDTAEAIAKLKREIAQLKHKSDIYAKTYSDLSSDYNDLNEYPGLLRIREAELAITVQTANEIGLLVERKNTQLQLVIPVIRIAIPPHVPGFEPDD